ncbi:MAG: 50S ribosomal protein L25 [Myxococcota bacterium]
MSEATTINVSARKDLGKGYARKLRRGGMMPAVVYTKGDSIHIALSPNALTKAMNNPKKRNTVLTFKFDDGSEKFVMLKDYQLHPVQDTLRHADFIEVRYGEKLKVEVPVVLLGQPKGVVRGGVLNQVRRVIQVECLPRHIPDKIEVDVSHLDIGNALHIKDITTSEELKLIYDVNFTVATVSAPTGLAEEAAAATVTAEGEGEGEAKAEGGEEKEKKAEEKGKEKKVEKKE